MAHSVDLNGTDLSGDDYNLTVMRSGFIVYPQTSIDIAALPYAYGGVSQGAFAGTRGIRLECVMRGTTHDDVKEKLDNLRLLLYQCRSADVTLTLHTFSDRYWMVRHIGEITGEFAGINAIKFPLDFVAPDPRAYSNTLTTQTETLNASPYSFDVADSGVVVAGTAQADPVWYIRNTTGGAVTSVILANSTRGETLTFTSSLANGYWIKVDAQQTTQIVYISTASGDDPTALSYNVSMSGLTGWFPMLSPGVSNTCSITGINNGTCVIYYRARYM